MPQEHQAILCPYCGHTQRKMDRCDVCGGSFDPVSKRGIAVNMGPWFLHDQRVPFRPGFNYTSMKRLITTGKVTANSIIRGPSTQQLWAPAKLTPGIAHLTGSCPRCETLAPPEAARCGNCAQPFKAETAYNELGLPFATGTEARAAQEELDREISRCNGRSRALRLWHHPDVPMLSLCPYCGDWQKSSDRCSTCGGVFDQLSQRATVIAMGPWFVRNKRFPYLPGCSYDVIRKQIEAKRIDASTILRGPTTRQFWSVAKNVPGISHLVGHCWSCGSEAKPGDAKCGNCGSPFGGVEKQNALGLPFATEAEALAAEQELEAQFNPMMPPTPVAPPPAPVSLTGAAALPRGINSLSHAQAGQAAFTGLDRASLAVIAAVMIEPARPVAAETDDANRVVKTMRQAPMGRSRGRKPRRSHPMIVAGLALLLAAGVATAILLFVNREQAPPMDDGKAPPMTAKDGGDTGNPSKMPDAGSTDKTATAPVDAASLRQQAMREWESLRDTNRDGQVGLSLDSIADLMAGAEALFSEGLAGDGVPMFGDAIREMERLRPRIALRDEATAARNKAAAMLITLDPTDLPTAGITIIEQTRMRFDEAQIHFDNADFEQARELWKNIETGLVYFEERMAGMAGVQAAEAVYLKSLDPDLDEAMLLLTAGDKWRQVTRFVNDARLATMNEKWLDARDGYGKASALAPEVMKLARPLAVRYWSCLAGQIGARLWHDHIDGATLDPRLRGIMRQLFHRLRLPFDPIDQAMLAPVTKKDLLKIILLDPASSLQQKHGDAALSTFQLGAHLFSLSRLLGDEAGRLSERQEREITQRLTDLKEASRTLGFNAKMAAQIQDVTAQMADLTEPTKVTKARIACERLLASLARADEAIDMLRE